VRNAVLSRHHSIIQSLGDALDKPWNIFGQNAQQFIEVHVAQVLCLFDKDSHEHIGREINQKAKELVRVLCFDIPLGQRIGFKIIEVDCADHFCGCANSAGCNVAVFGVISHCVDLLLRHLDHGFGKCLGHFRDKMRCLIFVHFAALDQVLGRFIEYLLRPMHAIKAVFSGPQERVPDGRVEEYASIDYDRKCCHYVGLFVVKSGFLAHFSKLTKLLPAFHVEFVFVLHQVREADFSMAARLIGSLEADNALVQ
jgi:hypothetical protein